MQQIDWAKEFVKFANSQSYDYLKSKQLCNCHGVHVKGNNHCNEKLNEFHLWKLLTFHCRIRVYLSKQQIIIKNLFFLYNFCRTHTLFTHSNHLFKILVPWTWPVLKYSIFYDTELIYISFSNLLFCYYENFKIAFKPRKPFKMYHFFPKIFLNLFKEIQFLEMHDNV